MRLVYILNKDRKLIEFCKISSERYKILKKITFFEIQEEEILSIEFNIFKIEYLIDFLLIEKNTNPMDIPTYEERFLENEIFEIKKFKNMELKLCNSGFDNKIIFLINIYNSILNNESPHYLLFTNNYREFKD